MKSFEKPLYDFSIRTFSKLADFSKGSHPRLEKLVEGRKDLFEKLELFRLDFKKPVAWFHVASLGEFEQAKPVISEFKKRFLEYGIVVSFFSPSGFDHVSEKPQEDIDFITYLPFDTPGNAKRFLEILNPQVAFFVKYDLWANHILEARNRNIPLFLFSASMRDEQIYFKSYGGFFRKILFSFDHIFCQNERTQNLLENAGYRETSITGDTRYDRVHTIALHPRSFPELKSNFGNKPSIVAGSVWDEDMGLIIPMINQDDHYNWIIAPHDIDAEQISAWQQQIKKTTLKYSDLPTEKEVVVIFIDNIGMLSSLYQFAETAYVGGAFGKGLHNILEPLAYGIPVIYGTLKKVGKFPEADVSKSFGCSFQVNDFRELQKTIQSLSERNAYLEAQDGARKLLEENLGSSKKIMDKVVSILDKK
ncbi:3-deoxy-D-manno-octulosonic acid transferase [Aquiflexum sp.]|uniref:3-deoxy-D-manno-octulosonic acid transferase n=1 Tax=Aquiflexum sp. TaxID=1872584 RepID=UPI0035946A28